MPHSPSIIPGDSSGQDVYLVLDDFGGSLGSAWRETDQTRTYRARLIGDLLDGQYNAP